MASKSAAAAAMPAEPRKPALPTTMRVLDSTATLASGPRRHEQVVGGRLVTYEFKPNEPLDLPPEVATKFLKHEAFRLIGPNGEPVAYLRRPKQPDELGAGEKLALGPDETVARYDELSNSALLQRALELPGGEVFAQGASPPSRTALIAFLKEARAKTEDRSKTAAPAETELVEDDDDDNADGAFD